MARDVSNLIKDAEGNLRAKAARRELVNVVEEPCGGALGGGAFVLTWRTTSICEIDVATMTGGNVRTEIVDFVDDEERLEYDSDAEREAILRLIDLNHGPPE